MMHCHCLTTLIFAVSFSAGTVPALTQDTATAESRGVELRQEIMACFVPPADANGTVLVAFELAADGSLVSGPNVVSQDGDAAPVAAAQRSIERCAPFRAGVEGKVEVAFEALGSPEREPASVAPGYAGEPLENAPVPYAAPTGFCFVDPDRSDYESVLWNAHQPPAGRREVLETLAVDCPTLV